MQKMNGDHHSSGPASLSFTTVSHWPGTHPASETGPRVPTSPLQCYETRSSRHTWVLGLELQSRACYTKTIPTVVCQPTATPNLPLASHRSLKPASQAGKSLTCSLIARVPRCPLCQTVGFAVSFCAHRHENPLGS